MMARARSFTLVVCAMLMFDPLAIARAEPKVEKHLPSKSHKKPRDGAHKRAATPKAEPDKARPEAAPRPTDGSRTAPTPDARETRKEAQRRAAQDAALGVDAEVVKEGETDVKVMSFSGLDIEGRLKSPQLLYFVGRVRAEFDRPTLPHRSFMPELEHSTKSAPLR